MEANEKFAYLPGFMEIRHDSPNEEHALALICDCGSYDRLGEYARLAKNARERYVVDHHITSSGEDFPYHTILPEASSTCEISFDLMDSRYFTKETATCLYTGIIHDTGVFKYNSTTAHTMEIAGKCMAIVMENIYMAIGIKVLFLILGAGGIANMWFAIFADVGVMILAVLNAMRALFAGRTA